MNDALPIKKEEEQEILLQTISSNDDDTITLDDDFLQDEDQGTKTTSIPIASYFILVTELCERFAYYGIVAVLQLYLTERLALSHKEATTLTSILTFWAYTMCLPCGIVADIWWGKFKTIWALSIVYILGLIILTVSSLPSMQASIGLPGVVVAIIFIGAGTGGIKANVSTFVADQIRNADELTTERVFRLFYLCINIGSFGGILLTPILHAQLSGGNGYWASFGLPAAMMCMALLIFVSGRERYVRQPLSRENALIKGIRMMRTAVENKRANVREGVLLERKEHWLDWAVPPYSATFVQGYKDFFKILAVFIPLPVYWALYNQQTNTWISQATTMNLQLSSSFSVTADQTQIIDPIVIVIFIPVVDQWLLPMLRRRGFPLKPITRMVVGLVIAASAFVAAALLQMTIDKSEPQSVSVAYQVPQYSLIALSEIFTSVTGLEIAYSQAPEFLKATVMAFYQLAVAGGAIIVIIISQGLAATPMFVQFWIYFGMMALFTVIFYFSFRRFKYRENSGHDRAE